MIPELKQLIIEQLIVGLMLPYVQLGWRIRSLMYVYIAVNYLVLQIGDLIGKYSRYLLLLFYLMDSDYLLLYLVVGGVVICFAKSVPLKPTLFFSTEFVMMQRCVMVAIRICQQKTRFLSFTNPCCCVEKVLIRLQ